LAKLERREKGLIAKAELQEGRIKQAMEAVTRPIGGRSSGSAGSRIDFRTNENASRQGKMEKLDQLRKKRVRLEHTLERLTLEATHKVMADIPNIGIVAC
jgi:DASH complex subunit SPC19